MQIIKDPMLIEPLLPPEGHRVLADLAFDLIKEASSLIEYSQGFSTTHF
jgi:hypothetical protein